MSPKNDQRDHGKAKNQSNPQDKPFSDEDVRQESSKAAHASMNAQKKAKELEAAAAGAGDPDERQKLTEQAVNAQVEAESFGKTAKYMQSGAFQGMAVGTGLGIAPGATLGAVTGTLVGGVTSTITGGLGGGIGTAAGAIGGPMVSFGELAGKGVRKFTGKLPSWVASDEQKQALENMMGQIQEQDMPDEKELKKMHEEGGSAVVDEGWMSCAQNMVSTMGGGGDGDGDQKQNSEGPDKKSTESAHHGHENTGSRKKPRKLETKSKGDGNATQTPASDRKKPKKLEKRSDDATEPSKKPETRSTTAKSSEERERMLRKMLSEHGVTDEEIEGRLNDDEDARDDGQS